MMNRQVVLVARPKGVAQARHFAIREAPVLAPADGQILVRNNFLSPEPAMRGWIADTGNYSAAVELQSVMRALAVGDVVESRHPDFRPGDVVTGWFGWQEFATLDASAVMRNVIETDLPRSLALGVLGINGVTALLALTLIGEPKAGDHVWCPPRPVRWGRLSARSQRSLAAEPQASPAGRKKRRNAWTCSATTRQSTTRRREWLQRLTRHVQGAFRSILTTWRARSATLSIHGLPLAPASSFAARRRLLRGTHGRRARGSSGISWSSACRGFVIFDHMERYEASVTMLAGWVRAGQLRYEEDILDGLESCPDALAELYRGENKGKRLITL